MKIQKIITSIVSFTTVAALAAILAISSAQAATAVGVETLGSASTTVKATTAVKVDAKITVQLQKIAERSDKAIQVRIDDLNKLNERIQAMKNITAEVKTNVAGVINTNIAGLTALKAKIDADTDVTTAMADEKGITGDYRIYALMIPQGYIIATADRVGVIADIIMGMATKIQARIAVAETAGKDVTALKASLASILGKVADARTQAQTAQASVAGLLPDQGDKTKMTANTTALKAARTNIKTATTDLRTAEQDMKKLLQSLKTTDMKVKAGATASTTVSQ